MAAAYRIRLKLFSTGAWLKSLMLTMIVAAAAVFLYLPTWRFDFTYLDDSDLILEQQPFLSNPSSLYKVFGRSLFGGKSDIYYRPVANINERIAQGVIGVHFNTTPSSNDVSKINSFRPQLSNPCTEVEASLHRRSIPVAPGVARPGNALIVPNAIGKVCVVSMTGKRVMRQAAAETGSMDLSCLPAGVYFAKTGNAMVKFIWQP
jgi:hypothetical protein